MSYIDKSREYYAAHGYGEPYRWASHSDVPFTPWESLGINLSDARVGVITTAFPTDHQRPKRAYAQASIPIPAEMFTDDLSWDKEATTTDDVGSFLPLAALEHLQADGHIGAVADRFYGVPTEYSQRRSHADAEHVLEWCRDDRVDIAVLVPL